VLKDVEMHMHKAATNQEFEKAARLRETELDVLEGATREA
jgi:excinuclease UvrABC nuclease subunit